MSAHAKGLMLKNAAMLLILPLLIFSLGRSVIAQEYDVEIRLNGGDDVAYIGEDNIVEVWIKNTKPIETMTLRCESSIGRNYQFDPTHGTFGHVNPEGDAVGKFWLFHEETVFIDNISTDSLMIWGDAMGGGMDELPVHSTHALCYTMKIFIPPGQTELPGGFCVDNIYWPADWPGAEWSFHPVLDPPLAPDFQGQANSSTTNPDAPPVCFDIVKRPAGCGDVNGDYAVNIGDAVYLINLIFNEGPPPLQDCFK